MLFVYYRQFPSATSFSRSDRIFPTFIVEHMPRGISGLLIAAILAAAMSNLSAALHRLQLREFLFPVTQHVRLDPAQVAHFTDREVALGGDRRQLGLNLPVLGHGSQFRPSPLAFGLHERSPHGGR